MSVTKNERALVVISDLTNAPADRDWLYNFIEGAGRTVCKNILKDDYGDYVTLYDSAATKARLIDTLRNLGANATIKAIDLIVMLHGGSNRLYFRDDDYSMSSVASDIAALNIGQKLRLVYSTACYGSSHNDNFRDAGFNTSIGAKKVNTNAAAELPALLGLWASGYKIKDALAVGENPATRNAADNAARAYATFNNLSWKNKVDSDKDLLGNGQLKINSNG